MIIVDFYGNIFDSADGVARSRPSKREALVAEWGPLLVLSLCSLTLTAIILWAAP